MECKQHDWVYNGGNKSTRHNVPRYINLDLFFLTLMNTRRVEISTFNYCKMLGEKDFIKFYDMITLSKVSK